MAVITSGKTFANGEQLSASKLNQVITGATFNQADAVDGSTMTIIGGAMAVADEGIATGKIAPGAVNFSKLTDVLDEDNMSSDSATSLATQKSIKAYVDSKGITQTTGTAPYYGCRAFGSFNGTDATPITAESSGNVTSIVKNSAGDYTITLTEALPTNCSVVASAGHNGGVAYGNSVDVYTTSTTEIRMIVAQKTLGPYDPSRASFAAFG
jgi:hypothetical protein